jgi:hypothetical protein
MDKISKYREYIQNLMTRYASGDVSDEEVEVQLLFDIEPIWYLIIKEKRVETWDTQAI